MAPIRTVYDLSGNVLVADSFESSTGVPVGGDLAAVQALTPVATADATDLATAQALANANKAKINQIIAALKG